MFYEIKGKYFSNICQARSYFKLSFCSADNSPPLNVSEGNLFQQNWLILDQCPMIEGYINTCIFTTRITWQTFRLQKFFIL